MSDPGPQHIPPPAPADERYRLLFDRNPQPMWVYDVQTLRFLAVNEAAIDHYGYSRDEFLGLTIRDIRPPQDASHLYLILAPAPPPRPTRPPLDTQPPNYAGH